jgi:hypothetical protein
MTAQLGRSHVNTWLVLSVAFGLAILSAPVLILLLWVWFLAVPMWLMCMLILAGICFAAGHGWRPAFAGGIGVLAAIPLTGVLAIAFLALASLH